MTTADKRAAMQSATNNAMRADKSRGWSGARKRARLFCHFMWPDSFSDPRERKPVSP
jgi:hypothetical protein